VAWRRLAGYEASTCDFAHRPGGLDLFSVHGRGFGRRLHHHLSVHGHGQANSRFGPGVRSDRGVDSLRLLAEIDEEIPGSAFAHAEGAYSMSTSVTPSAVPEPASLLFVGTGLVGFVARHRMSKKR
jgi:hypothetical protein